jgi:hypothetical protein
MYIGVTVDRERDVAKFAIVHLEEVLAMLDAWGGRPIAGAHICHAIGLLRSENGRHVDQYDNILNQNL